MIWIWLIVALVVGVLIGGALVFAACADYLHTIENINRGEDGYGD